MRSLMTKKEGNNLLRSSNRISHRVILITNIQKLQLRLIHLSG